MAIIVLSGASVISVTSPALWQTQGWEKTDFSKTIIDFSEILSGGPPKDGIPSIDNPKFHSLEMENSLGDKEPVLSFEVNGDARAYPIRILMWHEIVNDTVGGVPVVVTYCPLCNSSIVFERMVDNKLLDFGTSGKLRYSDLVMYDRQTQSWWQQFTGKAIVGKMVSKQLVGLPSRLESFASFKKRFPKGVVLSIDRTAARSYGLNPYAGYDTSKRPFFFDGEMPKGILPMAHVVAFKNDGKSYGVSLALLRQKKEIVKGSVRLQWRMGQNSALDQRVIQEGRDIGNVIVQKKIKGEYKDIQYEVTFAFAFHAFHPGAPIQVK